MNAFYFLLLVRCWKLGQQLLERLDTCYWSEKQCLPSAYLVAVQLVRGYRHKPHPSPSAHAVFFITYPWCSLCIILWHSLYDPLPLSCAWETRPNSCCFKVKTISLHIPQGSNLHLAPVPLTIYSTERSRKPLLTEYQSSYAAEVGRG